MSKIKQDWFGRRGSFEDNGDNNLDSKDGIILFLAVFLIKPLGSPKDNGTKDKG